jgi:hypothetical protein
MPAARLVLYTKRGVRNPLAISLAVAILVTAAIVAGYLPARRTSRIGPSMSGAIPMQVRVQQAVITCGGHRVFNRGNTLKKSR